MDVIFVDSQSEMVWKAKDICLFAVIGFRNISHILKNPQVPAGCLKMHCRYNPNKMGALWKFLCCRLAINLCLQFPIHPISDFILKKKLHGKKERKPIKHELETIWSFNVLWLFSPVNRIKDGLSRNCLSESYIKSCFWKYSANASGKKRRALHLLWAGCPSHCQLKTNVVHTRREWETFRTLFALFLKRHGTCGSPFNNQSRCTKAVSLV